MGIFTLEEIKSRLAIDHIAGNESKVIFLLGVQIADTINSIVHDLP